MQGSVKYQLEGSKMTITTGIEQSGKMTRQMVSDYHYHNRDSKGNLISIEIFGLGKIARSESAINLGEWGKDEKPKSNKKPDKNSNDKGKGASSTKK